MAKQRLRKWILNNQFFQFKGQFSKSAFIAMTTWVLVIFKYLIAGFSYTYTKAATAEIPAVVFTYAAKFDSGEAMALLSLCFGLYFGGKFSPTGNPTNEDAAQDRRDIRRDAAEDRKGIREDAAEDRKDIREGT